MVPKKWSAPTDIISCEDEPIHIIGQIQPHGVLLAVDKESQRVTYMSENSPTFFNVDAILGKTLLEVDGALAAVGNEPFLQGFYNVSSKLGDSASSLKCKVGDEVYNFIPHDSGDTIILEIEPSSSEEALLSTQKLLGQVMMNVHPVQENIKDLMQIFAREIKNLLKIDRVMIYKFHEDWHGEVIAEAKEEHLEPFLGLHYPATDIPKQARELFIKNLTRVIANLQATNVPIVSEKEAPLDLSMSQTRASSPIHIEYLVNMGVGASITISIVVEGKLWGLVACHHYSPKLVEWEQRKAAELIAVYLSSMVASHDKISLANAVEYRRQVVEALDNQMRLNWDVVDGLTAFDITLKNLLDCSGAAIVSKEEIYTVGDCPTVAQVREIANWIGAHKYKEMIFTTTNFSNIYEDAAAYADKASGVLSVSMPEREMYLLWFKPEQITTVNWGGKDEKGVVKREDGKFRLSPRKSFDKWAEEVLRTSTSWGNADLILSKSLKERISSILQLKANEIEKLNAKLKDAYADLDAFSYTLSHDLKTPINTIQGYLELYMEEEGKEDNPYLQKVADNNALMVDMVSNILEYSRLGRGQLKKEKVEVRQLIDKIESQMKGSRDFHNLTIAVEANCCVSGNRTMIYQVFLNLIENAIKYRHPNREPQVNVTCEDEGDMIKFCIEDNGIGINVKSSEKIFNLFQRLNVSNDVEGSGVGLSIVKKIVTSHGGRIWVESQEGDGSKFYFLLPRYE